ncbi:hypothetical protein K438DRAFT_1982171 [Mycena galopus ATCC 62051]|nr:hypothetical protein K438DRAFT_1982171 [Mycena galopus ATCC 62051]
MSGEEQRGKEERAALDISMYCLGFALVPFLISAFSEEFGRCPVFVWCTIVFTVTYVVQATASNIQTVIAARFICGAFGLTGSHCIPEPNRQTLPSCADVCRPLPICLGKVCRRLLDRAVQSPVDLPSADLDLSP